MRTRRFILLLQYSQQQAQVEEKLLRCQTVIRHYGRKNRIQGQTILAAAACRAPTGTGRENSTDNERMLGRKDELIRGNDGAGCEISTELQK